MLTDRTPDNEESIDDAIVKAVDEFLDNREPDTESTAIVAAVCPTLTLPECD
jgi:hypothetical protein